MKLKLLHVMQILAVSLILVSCQTSPSQLPSPTVLDSPQQEIKQLWAVIEESNNADDPIIFRIDESNQSINASASKTYRRITITQGVVKAYAKGILTKHDVAFLICHELGHLSPNAHLAGGGQSEEKYADYYAILLMDEMYQEGLGVNPREGIKIIMKWSVDHNWSDGIHPSDNDRYKYLTERLDYWDKHQGEIEAG